MADITVESSSENNQEVVSQNNITAPVIPELETKAVADVMGLKDDSEAYQYKEKVQTLLDYVKTIQKNPSPEDIRYFIRKLEMEVGSPPLSEKKIVYLARYAWLKTEEGKLQKEKELFTKHDYHRSL